MLDTARRVLYAVVVLHRTSGETTVGKVALRARLSASCAHDQLTFLRDAGLVTWRPRAQGTIRPTVQGELAADRIGRSNEL